ncbi:MAG: thiol protease/hemagglutinin PrtT [Tannerella sp.]|jgi:hypothetical protein|nr:thiol protease/hemagglutinin PrtT [Tannerella sp.]
MKKICFCLLAWIVAITGFSKNRTLEDARAIAASFCSQQLSVRSAPGGVRFTPAYICTADDGDGDLLRAMPAGVCYYVFNIGDGDGFIIIAGDDRANGILGYATSGRFDINHIPGNFRNWLGFYRAAMQHIAAMPDSLLPTVRDMHELADVDAYPAEVRPLLGHIAWGQREPFNRLSPLIPGTDERAVAGCVAIGMAQILKYYEWPDRGTGFKSYISEKYHIRLNADFAQTAYDWTRMRDTYTGEADEDEKNAAALLAYHCGVAAEMNYGYESSASMQIATFGMKDHFGYDPGMQQFERGFYTTREWYSLLKKELNASRPVFYVGGRESMAAHAFICDGYDGNGLFHFNWGWDGSNNGYFNVSVIEPQNMFGYNGGQNIVAGIQPARPGTPPVLQTQFFMADDRQPAVSRNTFGRNERFGFSAGAYHTTVSSFSGEIGLGLYRGDELTAVLHRDALSNLHHHEIRAIDDSISIPRMIADGNYTLHVISSADGIQWKQVRSRIMTPAGMHVALDHGTVTLSAPTDGVPDVALEKLTPQTEFYAGTYYGLVEAALANNGSEEAFTALRFIFLPPYTLIDDYLRDGINARYVRQEEVKFILLNPGERKTIVYRPNITIPAGAYFLYVVEDATNKCLNPNIPPRITVQPEPALALIGKISFPGEQVHGGDTFTLAIKNNGADFEGYIFTDLLDRETERLAGSLAPQPVKLRQKEEITMEIIFDVQPELLPGDYTLHLSYATAPSRDGLIFDFAPKEHAFLEISAENMSAGSPPAPAAFSFYPSPAEDILHVRSEARIRILHLYGLNGKPALTIRPGGAGAVAIPVHHLAPGIYILRCETDGGIRTVKFVKI